MRPQETIQIVQDLFAASGRGDKQALRALPAEDIEDIETLARARVGETATSPCTLSSAGATTGILGAAPAGAIVILALPYAPVLGVVKQYGEALVAKFLAASPTSSPPTT